MNRRTLFALSILPFLPRHTTLAASTDTGSASVAVQIVMTGTPDEFAQLQANADRAHAPDLSTYVTDRIFRVDHIRR